MIIKCEKCGQDISVFVDKRFEGYEVGKVTCPHCQKESKRYISEADILLYLAISETTYGFLTLLSLVTFAIAGVSILAIVIFIAALVFFYKLLKNSSRKIYLDAPFKQETKDIDFKEDKIAVAKNLRWQSMLFFAIAISILVIDQFNIFFALMMLLSVALSFVKFYLAVKREKEQ